MVKFMVLFTIGCELLGAGLLFVLADVPGSALQRWGWCVFHSVSAFCNAGFALQSDSLVPLRYALAVHAVMLPLIVLGGLGFPAMQDLARTGWLQAVGTWRSWRGAPRHRPPQPPGNLRLSLHTRLVLSATAVLYVIGVLALLAGMLVPHVYAAAGIGITANAEGAPPLSVQGLGAMLADASFMSLTARTAGFNTMPMDQIHPAGQFLLMPLMMVGASPGGTGGGIKTTTMALLVLAVLATVRGRDETQAFNRAIADELIRKAAAIAAGLVGIAVLLTFLLCLSEPHPMRVLAFEAVSAVTTTGLSLRDAELTSFGKVCCLVGMFLGRIGPLVLLAAMLRSPTQGQVYQYPHERVVLG